jgi:hypothetical protein
MLRPSHPPFFVCPSNIWRKCKFSVSTFVGRFYCPPWRSWRCFSLHVGTTCIICTRNDTGGSLTFINMEICFISGRPGPAAPRSALGIMGRDTRQHLPFPFSAPPQTIFPSFSIPNSTTKRCAQIPQTHWWLYCLSSNAVKCSVHLILLYFMTNIFLNLFIPVCIIIYICILII